MRKPTMIIQAPIKTRSGYGARARDLATSLLALNKYDIRIADTAWGITDGIEVPNLEAYIIGATEQVEQPDIYVQVTIPSEFQPLGKYYNIGVTAGLEADRIPADWVVGCNRMNLILASSEFSKAVMQGTAFTNSKTGQVVKVNTPIEVLFEGVDLNTYKFTNQTLPNIRKLVNEKVNESFAFLFTGHWLNGSLGEDRKQVGLLVSLFTQVFADMPNPPALILKTSMGATCNMQRQEILQRIDIIQNRATKGKKPPVYLIYGDLTDEEMNSLYNHPKVKAHISLTSGEGFGRPLAEAAISRKPIIVSAWSGHLDFLKNDVCLVDGKLDLVPPGARNRFFIEGSRWFHPDMDSAAKQMRYVYQNHKMLQPLAEALGKKIEMEFNLDEMRKKLDGYLTKYIPAIPDVSAAIMPTELGLELEEVTE